MRWRDRLGFAAILLAGFVLFYFVTTRELHAGLAIPFYLALLPAVVPALLSLYRRYGVGDWATALRLRRALNRNEIVLWYQPKVSVETGELFGVEALARWEHPGRGLLPPAHFIEAAERTWLAKRFNLYVMRAALKRGRAWDLDDMPVVLCVNVTPRVLASPDFAEEVGALLIEADYQPKLLELEVTESVSADSDRLIDSSLADPDRLIRPLERLAALGVRLSLDDFGTGDSSLRRIVDLKADGVKIDRSFVLQIQDAASAAVVRATTVLGHSLDLTVCAEGVETEEAWHRVRTLGCDVVQGYLIARPMPARDFAAWVRDWDKGGRHFVEGMRQGTAEQSLLNSSARSLDPLIP
jgi:EAL domain-containing protein (putative c-di-GMP-specific phosphodiesterase class I)